MNDKDSKKEFIVSKMKEFNYDESIINMVMKNYDELELNIRKEGFM